MKAIRKSGKNTDFLLLTALNKCRTIIEYVQETIKAYSSGDVLKVKRSIKEVDKLFLFLSKYLNTNELWLYPIIADSHWANQQLSKEVNNPYN